MLSAVDGTGSVAMDVGEFANVIGSMHSSGLIAIADAAGLAALISCAENPRQITGLLPLGTQANLEFKAPGRGLLLGKTHIEEEFRAPVRAYFRRETDRAHLRTVAEILDSAGTLVCESAIQWSVSRSEP